MLTFNGIPAAPGIAIGKAHVRHNATLVYREGTLDEAETQNQLRILQDALRISAHQLGEIADAAAKAGDAADAEIMQAHLAILEDEAFTDEIADEIVQMHMFAETAVRKVCQKYEAVFAGMDDAYMRERAADVSDICLRIAKNILGVPVHAIGDVREACVVIAHDLTPSDTMQFDKERILAFCTEQGGRTSHSAIIAKTHEIPAVMGLKNIVAQAGEGETVIVDGNEGVVLLNPDAQTLDRYSRLRSEYATRREALKDLRHLPAETKDGRRVTLAANIGSVDDARAALKNGAGGVGLFRTELLYMERETPPTEDEQYAVYREVAEMMHPHCVVIRTLDIGGDKQTPCLNIPHEENPFLGWRAIRISLTEKDLFKTQLRAILRASARTNIRIMYPMIADVTELRKANAVLRECMEELKAERTDYDGGIAAGVMIETPAAAVTADILIKEASFFSIGTNDLVQYVMAADRMNGKISHLCEPLNPGVLRLIRRVIDASHSAGVPVRMCGEMAGNPQMTPLLIGLGLDEFSMNAASIPPVKEAIRNMSFERAQTLAAKALSLDTADEIAELLATFARSE